MVSVQDILICVAQSELVGDWGLPASVWWSPIVRIVCRQRLQELSLGFCCSAWLFVSSLLVTCTPSTNLPRTSKLFSGSRFPLDMLSNMGFQISSLSASLLPGRSWPPCVLVAKLAARRALAIAEVLRRSQCLNDTCLWCFGREQLLCGYSCARNRRG
jgi:hypothetical protein